MTTCAVSVIIPLYNAAPYIGQCLLSVLASEFKDFEVIVVDDCSTDNSVTEVEKLLPYFDGRLKLLSTGKNSGGAGVPRNVGIQNASGKYVTFVDNDDMILPTALGDFIAAAEQFKADVVHTERHILFKDADLQTAEPRLDSGETHKNFVDKPTLESNNLAERMRRYLRGEFFWLPWGKLFRRDFLSANRIEFPQMRFSEDMVFCFKCLCLAERYVRVPFVNNVHRIREDSAARDYDLQTWLAVITRALSLMEEFMSRQEFFRRNAAVRHAVRGFVIDKSFSWIRILAKSPPREVYKFFHDALQSSAVDAKGKDILAACLCAERVLTR